ncbi:hypothetical protein ACOMHN_006347 [Nucella lapillus]
MEWERKFYEIVQETETNLANARRKLQGYDTTSKNSSPQLESGFEKAGYPYQHSASASFVNNNDHINYIRRHMGWSLPSTSSDGVTNTAGGSPVSNQLRELQTKMDSQSQTIENLEQLVKTLNQEKEQYREQITDLQDEVSGLSTRLLAKSGGVDPGLKSQVDLMRREVRSDLQYLRNAVNASSTSSGRPATAAEKSSTSADTLQRRFSEMQKNVHTEIEELRRDFNQIIYRVGKLELDMSTHSATHTDLQTYSQSSSFAGSPDHSALGYSVHTKRYPSRTPGDIFQVKELRNTVSQLRDKMDNLEGRVSASQADSNPWQSSFLTNRRPSDSFRSNLKVTFEDPVDGDKVFDDNSDLEDLALSEDFDLDLPMNDKQLSHELDEIINIGGRMTPQDKSKATSLDTSLDDFLRDLNDETDNLESRKPGGASRSRGRVSVGRWQREKEASHTLLQPSTSAQSESLDEIWNAGKDSGFEYTSEISRKRFWTGILPVDGSRPI